MWGFWCCVCFVHSLKGSPGEAGRAHVLVFVAPWRELNCLLQKKCWSRKSFLADHLQQPLMLSTPPTSPSPTGQSLEKCVLKLRDSSPCLSFERPLDGLPPVHLRSSSLVQSLVKPAALGTRHWRRLSYPEVVKQDALYGASTDSRQIPEKLIL